MDLCVTNSANDDGDGDDKVRAKKEDGGDVKTSRSLVTLRLCDGTVEQHYAFHGTAPGDPNNAGMLEFGDDTNALGISLRQQTSATAG
jgi:hypothetical protein